MAASEIVASVFGFNYTSYYPDPPPHWHGGWFKIFISNDSGATWRLIVEHGYGAPDGIEETERKYEQNGIDYNGREVFATESIKLYDISGRFITEGRTIRTDMLRNGLYIARTRTASRKVLVVN